MAAALEEHCSQEVINRDEAIRLLKEENESFEAVKARLSEEAKLLPAARGEVASLRKEKEELELSTVKLRKDPDDAEAAKDLAVQRATKAAEVSDRLREELATERESASSMRNRLKEAEVQASAIVGLYRDALGQFGGSTSAPPEGEDVAAILAWLKSHIIKLPDFVGGAVDFGALARVSFFACLLGHGGCTHVESMQKENIASASDVGESTSGVRRSVRDFISSFWAKFGWAEARSMAEAWRLEVCWFLLHLVCLLCALFLM